MASHMACPLAIRNFLWFSELICLRPCNFEISQEIKKIRILQSKTDQLGEEDELVIARTGNHICHIAMTERYMNRTGMSWNDQRYLFRPIQRTKKDKNLKQSGKISCICQRELFKKNISNSGLPPSNFWLHSLRACGETAVANAKVPDRLFK